MPDPDQGGSGCSDEAIAGLWGPQADWTHAEGLPELPPEEVPLEGLESAAIRQRLDVDAARKQAILISNAVDIARTRRLFTTSQIVSAAG